MEMKIALCSFFAFSKAASHHGYQLTGFSLCCCR